MLYLKIGEVAKILGINKMTLIRWDKDGLLPANREQISNIRYYDNEKVQKVAKWFDLRGRHRELLSRLGPVRKNLDRFISTVPLSEQQNPPIHKFEDLKKAVDDMQAWEKEHEAILREYAEFTDENYGGLEK